MTLKNKIYFIIFMILEFTGLLFFLGFIATRSLEAADNASEPEVLLSAPGLKQHSLTLVSSFAFVVEVQQLVEVLVNDERGTDWLLDASVQYDTMGTRIVHGC